MFPLPERRGPARRTSRRLHGDGHRGALQAHEGFQRPASDGLGRVRAARRAVCDQERAASARVSPRENVRQVQGSSSRSIGFNYDWDREVNTTDPGYFKWTQWIFRLLYESWFNPATNKAEPISAPTPAAIPTALRLAFVSEAPVNWLSGAGHGAGRTRRSSMARATWAAFPVERRPMRQWMLRITAYAERLINELDGLDWPDVDQAVANATGSAAARARTSTFILENFENRPRRSLVALALDTGQGGPSRARGGRAGRAIASTARRN